MNLPPPADHKPPRPRLPLPLLVIGFGLVLLGIAGAIFLAQSPPQDALADAGEGPSAEPVAVEFDAPPLKLKDFAGNPVALADYRGSIVMVNNWATWCPPCKAEMPTLNAFYNEHKDEGFVLIAIEAGSPSEDVAAFAEAYQLSFLVWPDPRELALSTFRSYSLPSSFVIDRDGVVRLAWTGAINRSMLEKYVTPLLEE